MASKTQSYSGTKKASLKSIQRSLYRAQLVLIVSLALMLSAAGILVNIHFENQKRDQNLQNTAQTIARSPLLIENSDKQILSEYLDSLMETLDDIDVISVVDNNRTRIYHSNSSLIGTVYDGSFPDFENNASDYYTVDETGPSGKQHRAYAAILNSRGECTGFVMAIMLAKNIQFEISQTLFIFILITALAVVIELTIAARLSANIKESLLGYEPDVFSAMYKMRDNILETLDEGILAVDNSGIIQFANSAAMSMLINDADADFTGQSIDALNDSVLSGAVKKTNREFNISLAKGDILLDRVPLKENGLPVGIIAVLHNRAEYSKLMEDLSGTRYLVDSMRANNHDFTNKLHVILGLIQMQKYDEAGLYIQNITMVQKENISKVMSAVNNPTVAALLIGKIARASELNVSFVLREGSRFSSDDISLPSEMLVTVIGNLLDNAFDAMNKSESLSTAKELLFGIYSRPGALLITVDDTGCGIKEDELERIFENGYSTKGNGRGTGLYQVKSTAESYGGKISVESQEGVGSSFTVSFQQDSNV